MLTEAICEDALSNEANELVSDLVGLPPTFGLCGGGLGGGARGLEGRVVAIEAGLLALFADVELITDDVTTVVVEVTVVTMGFLCFRGVIGGGFGVTFGDSEMLLLGSVSVGVTSLERQTGNKLAVLTSKLGCKMGPEMSNLLMSGL